MTLKLAIVGAGHLWHAMSYGQAVMNRHDAELVAVLDEHDPPTGRRVADALGVQFSDDPVEFLGSRTLDGVIVCAATADHAEVIRSAAQGGASVLCEKPITTTRDDAVVAIETCRAAGVQLHMAFVCRFMPSVATAREVVRSGRIGDVLGVVALNRGRPPLRDAYPPWITDPTDAGGGALMDHSVHLTDTVRFITGLEVTGVLAATGTLFTDLSVEDAAILTLTFDNGGVGTFDPSWSLPRSNPWEGDFRIEILGSAGTVMLDDTRESIDLMSSEELRSHTVVPYGADVDALSVACFIDSIHEGRPLSPAAVGQDGLRALEVALAAYESSRTGTMTSP